MELTQGSPYALAQARASFACAGLNPTDAAMLDYGYAQLTAATLGSAASALVMSWTVSQSGATAGLNVWLTLQLVISLAGLAAGQAYRSGLLRSRPQQALWPSSQSRFSSGVTRWSQFATTCAFSPARY